MRSAIMVQTTVALGEPVPIIITARDTDGLDIRNPRGHFFVVSIEPPAGDAFTRAAAGSKVGGAEFRLDVPVADLRVAGKYKVKNCVSQGSLTPSS